MQIYKHKNIKDYSKEIQRKRENISLKETQNSIQKGQFFRFQSGVHPLIPPPQTPAATPLFSKPYASSASRLPRKNPSRPTSSSPTKPLSTCASKLPQNEDEMLNVSGVGQNKLKKYGQRFLQEISSFLSTNH